MCEQICLPASEGKSRRMTFSADLLVINVQGLSLSKVDSIEVEYLLTCSIDFICLQETWANKADIESKNFHNYVLGSYYSRSKYA